MPTRFQFQATCGLGNKDYFLERLRCLHLSSSVQNSHFPRQRSHFGRETRMSFSDIVELPAVSTLPKEGLCIDSLVPLCEESVGDYVETVRK